nr:moeB [Erythrocladia irregularis]
MIFPKLDNIKLSIEEYKRYSRHLVLDEIGVLGQKRLKNSKVVIIGLGGLGNLSLMYLAASGIGCIGIVDYDVINLSNLQRQILYETNQVDLCKVEVAQSRISNLNSLCKVVTYNTKLNLTNAFQILSEFDIIVDASDNFLTRYILSDLSYVLNKPLVYGAILKTFGHISVFNYKGGPIYRDLYPIYPSQHLLASCGEGGIIGGVAAIISSLQVNEVLKIILGLEGVLTREMVIYDFTQVSFRTISVKKKVLYTNEIIQEYLKSLEQQVYTIQSQRMKLLHNEITLSTLQNNGISYILVDVRTPQEFSVFHLSGAKNIPVSVIAQLHNTNFLQAQSKNGKMPVVYCESDSRSLAALIILSKLKIKVFRLKGASLKL